jgi:hypothetical protein
MYYNVGQMVRIIPDDDWFEIDGSLFGINSTSLPPLLNEPVTIIMVEQEEIEDLEFDRDEPLMPYYVRTYVGTKYWVPWQAIVTMLHTNSKRQEILC